GLKSRPRDRWVRRRRRTHPTRGTLELEIRPSERDDAMGRSRAASGTYSAAISCRLAVGVVPCSQERPRPSWPGRTSIDANWSDLMRRFAMAAVVVGLSVQCAAGQIVTGTDNGVATNVK